MAKAKPKRTKKPARSKSPPLWRALWEGHENIIRNQDRIIHDTDRRIRMLEERLDTLTRIVGLLRSVRPELDAEQAGQVSPDQLPLPAVGE